METGPEGTSLQFDKAEYSSPGEEGARCRGCDRPIEDTYFELNGALLCPPCKQQVEQAFVGGSKLRRFVLATVFGSIVAALGSGLWYAVRALTNGWEVGLISVVIGIGVGKAVSRGSGGRGGWPYQALAVFLTYTAVAMTYVPLVLEARSRQSEVVTRTTASEPRATGAPRHSTVPSYAPDEGSPSRRGQREGRATGESGLDTRQVAERVARAAFVLGIAYAAPFLGGFDNIIGLLIIGFGLFEAWRYNKRRPLLINGPLRIRAGEPAAEAEAEKHG